MKIITPCMPRVRGVTKRAMDGQWPSGCPAPETYDSWFKVWAEPMVLKLTCRPKWLKTEKIDGHWRKMDRRYCQRVCQCERRVDLRSNPELQELFARTRKLEILICLLTQQELSKCVNCFSVQSVMYILSKSMQYVGGPYYYVFILLISLGQCNHSAIEIYILCTQQIVIVKVLKSNKNELCF